MAYELTSITKSMVTAGVVTLSSIAGCASAPCSPRNGGAAQSNVVVAQASPCAPQNPCAAKAPCSAKNPCVAKNPCAAKNPCSPCNPCNPCAAGPIDPKQVTRPAGTSLYRGDSTALLEEGRRLWSDPKISTNNLACSTCHLDGSASFAPGFAKPYPHAVAMVDQRAGMKSIALDEMVQFCLVAPMAQKPLPWNSRELAALALYTAQVQKGFNPCAAKNPCAANNPCAAKNPCAVKNSCAPK